MGCSWLLFSSCLATALLSKYGVMYYIVGRVFIAAWSHGAMIISFAWIIEMGHPANRNFMLVGTTGAIALGGILVPAMYDNLRWQLVIIIISVLFMQMIGVMFLATESFRFLFSHR